MRILLLLIILFFTGCKSCNQDVEYVRGVRKLKDFTKHYADSINEESKKPVK